MNSLSVQVEQRVPSLVNTATMRVPVGGKVRPGIKILTKAAKQHDAAVRIYSAGVAEGKSFEQIEREISSSVPGLKNPLVMRNVAWFTVRPGDFANPALAKQIMDLYATDLGDGNGRRLYRFPAVFVADDLKVVMPSALRCFTRSELRFWSEYGPDRVRYCMTRAPVPRTPEGKVVRLFGGRQIVRRADNEGRCDPLVCAEYQRKECNLSASFVFYIPGVASLQPLEMLSAPQHRPLVDGDHLVDAVAEDEAAVERRDRDAIEGRELPVEVRDVGCHGDHLNLSRRVSHPRDRNPATGTSSRATTGNSATGAASRMSFIIPAF